MTHNNAHARNGNPPVKPRAIVWDLFGDHLRYVRDGVVPMRVLNQLLAVFGVGESTTRVVLSRRIRDSTTRVVLSPTPNTSSSWFSTRIGTTPSRT